MVRRLRVIGGKAVSDNTPAGLVVRAERSEFQLALGKVADGALPVAVDGRAAGHADMSPAVRMVGEELGVDAHRW